MTRGPAIFVFTHFAPLILFLFAILLVLGQRNLPLIFLPYSPLLCYCRACTIPWKYASLSEWSTAKTPSLAKPQLCFSRLPSSFVFAPLHIPHPYVFPTLGRISRGMTDTQCHYMIRRTTRSCLSQFHSGNRKVSFSQMLLNP